MDQANTQSDRTKPAPGELQRFRLEFSGISIAIWQHPDSISIDIYHSDYGQDSEGGLRFLPPWKGITIPRKLPSSGGRMGSKQAFDGAIEAGLRNPKSGEELIQVLSLIEQQCASPQEAADTFRAILHALVLSLWSSQTLIDNLGDKVEFTPDVMLDRIINACQEYGMPE